MSGGGWRGAAARRGAGGPRGGGCAGHLPPEDAGRRLGIVVARAGWHRGLRVAPGAAERGVVAAGMPAVPGKGMEEPLRLPGSRECSSRCLPGLLRAPVRHRCFLVHSAAARYRSVTVWSRCSGINSSP